MYPIERTVLQRFQEIRLRKEFFQCLAFQESKYVVYGRRKGPFVCTTEKGAYERNKRFQVTSQFGNGASLMGRRDCYKTSYEGHFLLKKVFPSDESSSAMANEDNPCL